MTQEDSGNSGRSVIVDDVIRIVAFSWRYGAFLLLILLAPGALLLVYGRPIGLLMVAVAGLFPLLSHLAIKHYPHRFLGDDPVTTPRLRVARAEGTGYDGYLRLLDDDFMGHHHWSEQARLETRRLLTDPRWRRMAASDLALVYRRDGPDRPIGFVSLARTSSSGHRWMIGAHLRPDSRSRGYMTEALRALLPVFAARGIPEVHLACHTDNEAMMTVARRVGMVRLTDDDAWRLTNGETTPAALFVWRPTDSAGSIRSRSSAH